MRHRILTDNCKWILDGKVYDSDEALDLEIQKRIKNGTYKLENNALQIIQSVDLQARAKNIIEQIKSEISGVAKLVTPETNPKKNVTFTENAEETESYYIIDNSIGVNRFLRTFPKPGTTSKYVQPFMIQD